MVETVAVSDQRVGHTTQIQQTIPVCVVARQPRNLQPEHNADSAQSHLTDHAREAGAVGHAGAGNAKIFIDDGDLLWGPAEFTSTVHQAILAGSGLAIVLHLGRGGLTDVDEGCPLGMNWFDLAGLRHVHSPGWAYWPRRL